ncbi:hypothetical protein I6N91_11730 [Arthrobacter sp. MSA 4-2]|uniref:hypothetical protein n=1 Tax=Arthrobacter sp. MSA 4-2 TaxID=2794349 RepID=UPI0018E909A8|nr:hypothetical protein [Arthrobacter sp. MSA 4-2]MBJ2121647.1 hypothetical protein [Arthrobacter sp. MSA 4-2]
MSQAADGQESAAGIGSSETGMNWKDLRRGQAVTVEPVDGHSLPGWVDDLAEDRSMLWIQLGEGRGRRLIHAQDGVAVRSRRRG